MLYLASSGLTIQELTHILHLERALVAISYPVIVPQCAAYDCMNQDGSLNKEAMAGHLAMKYCDPAHLFVGSLDNAMPDSEVTKQYADAIKYTGRAVIYSTDCKISGEEEMGRNTLFNFQRTVYAHLPCSYTAFEQVNPFYKKLASKIHDAIKSL